MAKNLIQEMEQEVIDHIGQVGDDALSSLGKKCTELVEVRTELAELDQKKKELDSDSLTTLAFFNFLIDMIKYITNTENLISQVDYIN